MSLKFGPLLTLALALFVLQSVAAGQTLPPATQWIPGDAVVSLELAQPKALLDLFAGKRATTFVKALPAYKALASTPQFQQFFACCLLKVRDVSGRRYQ